MTAKSNLLTPIAEYRGVCVLERGGDVRAIWQGREYTTDGSSYVMLKPTPGADVIKLLAFPTERMIKQYLDSGPGSRGIHLLCSWAEVHRVVGRSASREVPRYRWDDFQGVFVEEVGK
jgi:hypothetical protein